MKSFTWIMFALCLSFSKAIIAQSKTQTKTLFFSSGAGVVYSFFETDDAPFQFSNLKNYTISKTFGRSFDFEVGRYLKKNFSFSIRYGNHKFSNKFTVNDTIINTTYEYKLSGNFYRNQYYWQLLIDKRFENTKQNSFGIGTGIMFVNDGEQFSTKSAGTRNISNPSASFYEFRSWEFGTPIAVFYERKLNANVSFGVKTQAYILISVGGFESISLNPYIIARF